MISTFQAIPYIEGDDLVPLANEQMYLNAEVTHPSSLATLAEKHVIHSLNDEGAVTLLKLDAKSIKEAFLAEKNID